MPGLAGSAHASADVDALDALDAVDAGSWSPRTSAIRRQPESPPAPPSLAEDALRAAVASAAATGRSPVAVLAETSGLDGDALARALGAALRYPVLESAALMALAPAFDLLGPADAARRGCVIVKRGAEHLAVIGNPFDLRAARLARAQGSAEPVLAPRRAGRDQGLRREVRAGPARDGRRGGGRRRREARRCRHREPVARLDQRRLEPGRQARALDRLRRPQGRRQRHPPRDAPGRPRGPLPRRRRARARRHARRRGALRAGDLARQGHERARHRRAARAAGRPLQARAQGPADRLPRLGDAERARRGRGAAHPRQAGADRRAAGPAARRARLRAPTWSGACGGCRSCPTACCS